MKNNFPIQNEYFFSGIKLLSGIFGNLQMLQNQKSQEVNKNT
jgi:hypothetical protein